MALSSSIRLGLGRSGFSHVFASDFSGDDHADILGVNAAGALVYYPNNGLAISSGQQLASGWGSFTHVM